MFMQLNNAYILSLHVYYHNIPQTDMLKYNNDPFFSEPFYNEPTYEKTNKMTCLIRVFAVCMKNHWVLSYP